MAVNPNRTWNDVIDKELVSRSQSNAVIYFHLQCISSLSMMFSYHVNMYRLFFAGIETSKESHESLCWHDQGIAEVPKGLRYAQSFQ
jgi:hypothetical protein